MNAPFISLTALDVGVHRKNWKVIDATKATEDHAKEIMREFRFDVLPIKNPSGMSEYFATSRWNDYQHICRNPITEPDLLRSDTSVSQLVRKFADENRFYYFLERGGEVIGLVSVVNLNSRQVKVYLFGILCDLEMLLGAFVAANVSPENLCALTFERKGSRKCEEAKKRYAEDQANGVDVPFVEYVYLSDLVNITKKLDLCRKLDYEKRAFGKLLGPVVILRNTIAHPTRSVVTSTDSVARLWKTIAAAESLAERLRLLLGDGT